MKTLNLKISRLDNYPAGEEMVKYATASSSGIDLKAAIEESVELNPLERVLIPTGIKIELPEGYEAQVRPRSGLALKEGLTVLNTPGTIDNDYRGEIKVILINLGQNKIKIDKGQKIAQMVIASFAQANLVEVEVVDLTETVRASNGFGSTGV